VTQPTLYDLIWDEHVVDAERDGTCLLYVDRHIVHEVDSPQAFDGLRRAGLRVRAPEKTLLVVDHNVPTSSRAEPNPPRARRRSPISRKTPSSSGWSTTTSWTGDRAFVTSSDRSKASRFQAP
jgi:homoaconitase/3-isopropylmalate dehydratase large subunit